MMTIKLTSWDVSMTTEGVSWDVSGLGFKAILWCKSWAIFNHQCSSIGCWVIRTVVVTSFYPEQNKKPSR